MPALLRASWLTRTWVLAAIILSAFNLRTAVTSLTPLLDSLANTFRFSLNMMGVFGMLPTAVFSLFGMVTPMTTERLGLERAAFLAMLLAMSGLFARSLANNTAMLFFSSIVALSGMGIGNVILPPLVKQYFSDHLSTVSTLYITVLQLGTILPALLAVPMAEAVGWRVSLGVWSLIALAAMLPWAVVLWIKPKHDSSRLPKLPSTVVPVVMGDQYSLVPGRVWRSPVAWGLALMFGMTSLVTYAIFTWLPKLLLEAGGSPALGGNMVALFATFGLISTLCLPALAVRLPNPFLIVFFSMIGYLIAFAGLLFAPMAAPLLWVALLGLGPSSFPLSLILINLRTRTSIGSIKLSGFMQGLGYALSCLGPLVVGWLHNVSQGWYWPFFFLSGCLLILLFGSWLACQPRMLEDSW